MAELKMAGLVEKPNQEQDRAADYQVKVYGRRWVMLAIYAFCATSNAAHWLQFSIIANIIIKYYNVSSHAVNWTSMVYMAAYVLLVLPASWLLDKKGLKVTLLCGAVLMTAGSWIKVASVARHLFYVAFLGQTFVGAAQIFIIGLPARLAAVWFGPDQVSTATAIGVFGIQVGMATGFVIPPAIVGNHEDADHIGGDLMKLYVGLAVGPTIALLLVIFVFRAAPKLPPSEAQASVKRQEEKPSYFASLKALVTNRNFLLLVISYGINMGTFYAVSTLLNQILLVYFENSEADGGRIGFAMVLAGVFGSVIGGVVLDKTHKFKETSLVVYSMALLGMVGYTFSFKMGYILIVYAVGAFLGFFITSYLTIGFEFAAELTYPEPEGTSSGLLNMMAEICGVGFTMITGKLLVSYGDLVTNITMCVMLAAGFVATMMINGKDLRRQAASRQLRAPETEMLNIGA
ncbi:uncharacterized MFS-type transporter C09D4.1-like isoform X2 [Bacillus rossius redtenbacheri]|uniref:uncharacterized MFS-type transporter C09D4.1-like isoform X2 n=1 Tax=Bacillus rossius redtenbacheri TaxID=93214 RepID=UPI002FDE6E53